MSVARSIMLKSSCARTFRVTLTMIGVVFLFCGISTGRIEESGAGRSGMNSGKSHIIDYVGKYDPVRYPHSRLDAPFTTTDIDVDGVAEAVYDSAPASPVENFRAKTRNTDYVYAPGSEPYGVLKALWDGPLLYLFVQVRDATPMRGSGDVGGAIMQKPAVPGDLDSVQFGFDIYNDKVPYETDTTGMFTVGSDGRLYFFRNQAIPSLGSAIGDPLHPEYANIIAGCAARDIYDEDGKTVIGYAIEVAIHIEKVRPGNGTTFGVDLSINDVADQVTRRSQSPGRASVPVTGPARVGTSFWSHDQDDLYEDFDPERPNAVDWGNVRLIGWDGKQEFKYSDWRLSEAVRYLDSVAFPKGVYTPETQAALVAARRNAEMLLERSGTGRQEKAKVDMAADQIEAAIADLRWADTRYPDPADLPVQNTLPDPYRFFNRDRLVRSRADWKERRREILDLAQFYEYGYKPGAPDSMEVTQIRHVKVGDNVPAFRWNGQDYLMKAAVAQQLVTIAITVGNKRSELTYTIYLPTAEQLDSLGKADAPVPVVLSFDGDNAVYRKAGYAVVKVPSGSGGDVRTDEYAWGTRTGTFYELYPYSRNGDGALREVSSEMAAAWSASRVIDSLEMIAASPEAGASTIGHTMDLSKIAVTGFSINGKYAFVSAVFDERILVCVPGAAGASGPSPWRYVYIGQQYDWTGTPFAPAERTGRSPYQVASGTEFMANSIRHNRVREIELFRHFLTPGRFYQRLPGAYGFGTRLPYDQNDLVATLAPRAIILVNTVNDYNDGCLADSLSLQVAKSVYVALGFDADNLIKFNQRAVEGPGDPHGMNPEQWERNADYFNNFFYGAEMPDPVDTWLNTDPFNLKVSNERTQTPYDFYYGGFNTITGGSGGAEGRDGWYYYTLGSSIEGVN